MKTCTWPQNLADKHKVADNWDEAEDSEEERKKAATAAAAKAKAEAEAAKNKKSKAQRIEEHREANRRKKVADMDEEEDSDEDEDEAAKRERLRRTEQDSDLKHAEDLFDSAMGPAKRGGKAIVVENQEKPGEAIDLSKIALFRPATKTQFEQLSEVLVPLLRASSTKPHYAIWVQNFCKQICQDLPSAEMKKAASTLTALSNEKMKEEKNADKSGKKTKAQKTKAVLGGAGRDMGRGNADTTAYEGELEEDDFM